MSLSYRSRPQRSSWCSDSSTTGAVSTTRPLSGYGSVSGSGRLDYGTGSSSLASYRSRVDTASSRTGLYPSAASSARSSATYGDPVLKRISASNYSASRSYGSAGNYSSGASADKTKRDTGFSETKDSTEFGSLSHRRRSSENSSKVGSENKDASKVSEQSKIHSRGIQDEASKRESSSGYSETRQSRLRCSENTSEVRGPNNSGATKEAEGGSRCSDQVPRERRRPSDRKIPDDVTLAANGQRTVPDSSGKVGLSFKDYKKAKANEAPQTETQADCPDDVSVDQVVEHRHASVTTSNKSAGAGVTYPQQNSTDGNKEDASKKGLTQASQREDQGKKLRVNSSSKTISNVQATAPSTADARGVAQKEIVRLESLCEARTKELTHAKIQLKATIQGFDAMAVLVNYCCAELNAFECPILADKLATVQRQLTDCLAQISELTTQKEELNTNLSQVIQEKEEVCKQIAETLQSAQAQREEHAKMTKDMDDTHNAALTTQRDELTTKHEEALKKFLQYYDKQIEFLKQSHERQVSEMKNESKLEMNGIRISHLEEIQELRNKHDSQMEELHKQHRNKLEDITHRFETIKLSLSEKVESLRGECEDLRHRARNSEEALQRDADVKVQMALAPFMSLPAEIESLKTVVEMRNEEIQKLRTKNMDLEKQLEEVPIGREKIISLQQKVENLEAIINIKTDHEKQMHEHCQVLMRKYDRASRANKRLSMDYEQVMWRMSQSSEFGSSESLTQRQLSKSPTRSDRSDRGSPDGRHRTLSPNPAGEVVMRKKRNSQSVGEGEQKLRSRSATFVLEKHESSDSHSPSSSPQPKLKRWRKKSEAEEKSGGKTRLERMCRSAGAELISDLVSQEAWAEKEKATLPDAPNSLTSSIDNTDSYSRSVSGVSDSGVYDSMSRSDMLNSSVVSTDSEWATSVNLSMNLDSNMEDLDSGPKSGDFVSLNDVTIMSKPGGNKSLMKSSNTVVFCMDKNCDPSLETSKAAGDAPTTEFTRPETADDVFDESISMESSCCSFDNFDVTSASDSRLTSASEDMSANETVVDNVSDVTLTCNISLEKSPQISSVSPSK